MGSLILFTTKTLPWGRAASSPLLTSLHDLNLYLQEGHAHVSLFRRQDHGVDHMDDPIGGHDIGGYDSSVIHRHGAVFCNS